LKIAQKKADPVPAAPLKRMHEAIIRLTEIIEVSLQRDRLSGDRIELSPLPLDARQLVDEAVQIARSAYPGREVNLVQRSGSGDLIIPADAPLLKTALINLVENALKYSPDNAPVEITLALSEADMVSITIADHGIGIQPKDRPFIFDKYYRAANATGRSGAGVGLYLVRVIVTAHGGNVMVASSPQGSQFTVTLPLAQTTNGAT
ncbi:MAG: ATP-binding protein, partial [Maritimibacter sp.]